MTESNPPPPNDALDPAALKTDETHDEEEKDHKLRDSKGWDGKLRLTKKGAAPPDPDAPSEPEASEDEGPEPEQLAADEDLLDDMDADETDIDLVHFRISSIPALRLERFKKLQVSIMPPRCHSRLTQSSVCASVRTRYPMSRYQKNSPPPYKRSISMTMASLTSEASKPSRS
jgi:hypothetical protein